MNGLEFVFVFGSLGLAVATTFAIGRKVNSDLRSAEDWVLNHKPEIERGIDAVMGLANHCDQRGYGKNQTALMQQQQQIALQMEHEKSVMDKYLRRELEMYEIGAAIDKLRIKGRNRTCSEQKCLERLMADLNKLVFERRLEPSGYAVETDEFYRQALANCELPKWAHIDDRQRPAEKKRWRVFENAEPPANTGRDVATTERRTERNAVAN